MGHALDKIDLRGDRWVLLQGSVQVLLPAFRGPSARLVEEMIFVKLDHSDYHAYFTSISEVSITLFK